MLLLKHVEKASSTILKFWRLHVVFFTDLFLVISLPGVPSCSSFLKHLHSSSTPHYIFHPPLPEEMASPFFNNTCQLIHRVFPFFPRLSLVFFYFSMDSSSFRRWRGRSVWVILRPRSRFSADMTQRLSGLIGHRRRHNDARSRRGACFLARRPGAATLSSVLQCAIHGSP